MKVLAQVTLPTDPIRNKFSNLGEIISGLLPYIYVLAGLGLLLMLISGGIELMTTAGNPKKIEVARGKITSGLIGFLLVFISYFVVQLVEIILGVSIL